MRFFLFGDSDPFTQVFLGPLLEESVKFAAVLLALIVAAIVLPAGRDRFTALQYWLFLVPWFVGGLYGFVEGVVVYPGEGIVDFTTRETAHATFVALSLAGTLLVWRSLDAGAGGAILGGFAGFGAHLLFNVLPSFSGSLYVAVWSQVTYAYGLFAFAVIVLGLVVRREPSSPEARRFLAVAGEGLRP